tara:strand:+ start:39 stop:467 length:429 start_codon:yes stop_codon:yes gene_type:complete
MKINPYYIAGGVALLVILIVVFTQRSDWKADRFILSADSKGNLTPVSESYFEGEEKKMMEKVAGKLAGLEFTFVKPVSGPNVMWRNQHQSHASDGGWRERLLNGESCGQIASEGRYVCPAGSMAYAVSKGNGRCGCVVWKYG